MPGSKNHKTYQLRIKKFTSFLIGFIISATTICILTCIYLVSTFNLAGGESIEQIKNSTYIQLLLSLIIFLFALFFTFRLLKKEQKTKAIGVIIIPGLLFLYMSAFVIEYEIEFQKFNREVWMNSRFKPLGMSKTLYFDNSLIGLSKNDIISILGHPSSEFSSIENPKSYIDFMIDGNWTLTIYFLNDIAISQSLRQQYLGI
ncbi:hypothetical protein [Polluticaenibacter yanchengensis]|uniref:Uncharacterized protein n=1 Tax=Polluticaenibacter yanchengensis TaxID=3014562 RepID=A0ABT4UJ34_9BACT|nr:hypothetical protein [Chitinophagaceae bacterium LY-5]